MIIRTTERWVPSPNPPANVSFFLDDDGSACESFDVLFLPRLYCIDADWRFRYIQPHNESLSVAVRSMGTGAAKAVEKS
jgi:hypothetical protein